MKRLSNMISNISKKFSSMILGNAAIPKYYAYALNDYPPDYYNYEQFSPEWGNQDDYEIIRKLGRGKYSEVYEGINVLTDKKVIIKILKPVKYSKIQREAKILMNLDGQNNIVKLLDIVKDPASKSPCLILEYNENLEFRELYSKMSDLDLRYYIFGILKALDYCNSKGIMHRDIKPHNIIFDPKTRNIRLIDWGLAEFYKPHTEYNVRVASRFYKGPELLLDYTLYDYSHDIWSLGCVFAEILFAKHAFFVGKDNEDQLFQIIKVLGINDFKKYIEKYRISVKSEFLSKLGNITKKNWKKYTPQGSKLCNDLAFDLLDKMLVFDHAMRITPKEAMNHPYFYDILEQEKSNINDCN